MYAMLCCLNKFTCKRIQSFHHQTFLSVRVSKINDILGLTASKYSSLCHCFKIMLIFECLGSIKILTLRKLMKNTSKK